MNFINVPKFDEMSIIKRHFIKLGHSDNLDNRHLVKLVFPGRKHGLNRIKIW